VGRGARDDRSPDRSPRGAAVTASAEVAALRGIARRLSTTTGPVEPRQAHAWGSAIASCARDRRERPAGAPERSRGSCGPPGRRRDREGPQEGAGHLEARRARRPARLGPAAAPRPRRRRAGRPEPADRRSDRRAARARDRAPAELRPPATGRTRRRRVARTGGHDPGASRAGTHRVGSDAESRRRRRPLDASRRGTRPGVSSPPDSSSPPVREHGPGAERAPAPTPES
jgi:hypothetical protein